MFLCFERGFITKEVFAQAYSTAIIVQCPYCNTTNTVYNTGKYSCSNCRNYFEVVPAAVAAPPPVIVTPPPSVYVTPPPPVYYYPPYPYYPYYGGWYGPGYGGWYGPGLNLSFGFGFGGGHFHRRCR